jgi:methylmalonyl-CoA mutase
MRKTTQTRAQWEAKAGEELDGRPLQSLFRTTADGIEVAPLYLRDALLGGSRALGGGEAIENASPGGPRALGGGETIKNASPSIGEHLRARTSTGAGIGLGWMSVQEYRHADPRLANAAARRDLELGADGLRFIVDSELRAGRAAAATPDGLVCDPDAELATLLEGIDPTRTRLWFDAGLLAPRWADALERWIDDTHTADAPEAAPLGRGPSHGGVIYDPFTPLVATGSLAGRAPGSGRGRGDNESLVCDVEAAFATNQDAVLGMRVGLLGVSTAVYHDAGATEADELALALASCAELLRHGNELGLEFADIADAMIWTLPIAGRLFEGVAKLRAARVVWAKFSAAAGLPHTSLWIHATSSQRTWTRHGAWVNLLRGTVGSFAAAVGGADSIATAAFDGLCGPEGDTVDGLGRGSELGRRLAIDTQMILREESQLARVVDPAGGSWYVESLTDALARAAWQRFRVFEQRGGLLANLRAGSIQAEIESAAKRLRERVATRKLPLTGLSTYPTLDDPPTPDQAPNHAPNQAPNQAGSTGVESLPSTSAYVEVAALGRLRLAAPFERLRDAAQRHVVRPRVYACNLGLLAAHQARLEFASNCFAAGGLELCPSDGFALDDLDMLIGSVREGMRASGCALAVVCGRDQDYSRLAAAVVVALRNSGAKAVWIAGRPPSPHDADSWGLDPELPPRFMYLGGDVLIELEFALAQLGALEIQEVG